MKVLRFLLFPVAIVYNIITSIRNLFFDIGFFKQKEFDIPVVAVGNLSVGGTGKSPQVEYLIRLLKEKYRIATLSRGYKRKTKGFQLVNETHSAEDVGDEPMQFYKKFKELTVAVDANRVNGIDQLIENSKAEVVLLDDAFQHRKVKASFYILLTKYDDLYSDDFVLPTGNLRESRRGAKRANVIVVTKCPNNLSEERQRTIVKKLKISGSQQVFFSGIKYGQKIYSYKESMNLGDLKNSEIVVVTGIASPKSLLQFLREQEIDYKHIKFPDHHNFSERDLSDIRTTLKSIPAKRKLVLTTEKDYVRLGESIDNLYYLPIESSFLNKEKEFNIMVLNHIDSIRS
ncbi:lipid-A-disaccharide kinase [Tenacibaculum sp. MAR_2009_124]|uniref:tetraacyldisaccharide 4'-kinase n=1 Tax=Tenacibaculum sp. MAR_2009_124 TaxID=1250059 RepID=UPI00089D88E2|nr:tetraacyldisaccharide 4'-kinase [Tenacibaculum sp. MAR_2009_124]SEB77981.1 lipid-A-disaccharide kinase [Tenacibaculum sp. MAR_2009_124]